MKEHDSTIYILITVCVDRGYGFDPHNVKTDDLTMLQDFCKQVGAVFVSPEDADTDEILQFQNGRITMVPTESLDADGLASLIMNHKAIVGCLRKAVEIVFAHLKQDKFLGSSAIHWRYLKCLPKRFITKLKLNPNYGKIPLVNIIYSVIIDSYTKGHLRFHLQYADEELQRHLVDHAISRRLNYANPMTMDLGFPFEISQCPRSNAVDWIKFPISQIEDHRNIFGFNIPILEQNDETLRAIFDLGNGTYRLIRAPYSFLLLRMLELKEIRDTFPDYQAYIEACKTRPQDTPIFVRHMDERPTHWDNDIHGVWPDHGLLIVYLKMPSSNHSIKLKSYHKHVMICFSQTPNDKLGLAAPFKNIFMWLCYNAMGRPDVCNRT